MKIKKIIFNKNINYYINYYSKIILLLILFIGLLIIIINLIYGLIKIKELNNILKIIFIILAIFSILISHIIIRWVLIFYKYLKNITKEKIIVVINEKYPLIDRFIISFGLIYLIKYFKKRNVKYNILLNISITKFVKIMTDKDIKEIYLFGHGFRYGYCFKDKNYLYKNLLKFNIDKKDFIAQLHCNHLDKKYNSKDNISLEKFANKSYISKKERDIWKNIKYCYQLYKNKSD